MVSPRPVSAWAPADRGRRLCRSASSNFSQWSFSGMNEVEKEQQRSVKPSTRAAAATRNKSSWAIHGWGPEVGTEPKRWSSPMARTRSVSPQQGQPHRASTPQRSATALRQRPTSEALVWDRKSPSESSGKSFHRQMSFEPPPRPLPVQKREVEQPKESGQASESSVTRSRGHVPARETHSDRTAAERPTTAAAAARLAAAVARDTAKEQPAAGANSFRSRGAHEGSPRPQTPMSRSTGDTTDRVPKAIPVRPSAENRAGKVTEHYVQERKTSNWLGPPAPERAKNVTLKRGSNVLPFGPMHLQDGAFSREYGKAHVLRDVNSPAGVSSPANISRQVCQERSFGRGTQALPSGPMCVDGSTHDAYGSMYQPKSGRRYQDAAAGVPSGTW